MEERQAYPEREMTAGGRVSAEQAGGAENGNRAEQAGGAERGTGTERYGVETCETRHVHPEAVARLRGLLPDEDTLYDLTELFRIFADSTRVRILYALLASEMCVCDVAALLGLTQSAVSHQLRALKTARLVKSRRDGKTVFYSLADDHVKTIIDQGLEHISE